MLQKIRTYYFLRIIFSFIDDKRKLKLIKYNKSLQENMKISLINYKIFSGKYIIYEQNGKGKEYDYDGHIIYEGEFLNGERNGKGKEYYGFDDKLKFEGEYLNNERWKGNCYDKNGNIIYVLNKENDIVKEYNDEGKLEFEGEYLNGKRNGKGKEFDFLGNIIFEGKFFHGKKWKVKDMIVK